MKHTAKYWIVASLLLASLACQLAGQQAAPTPTLDLQPTYQAQTAQAEQAAQASATAAAQASATAQAKADAAATEAASATAVAQATEAAKATEAFYPTATYNAYSTQMAEREQSTATAYWGGKATSTALAAPFVAQVEKLMADGVVPNAPGSFEMMHDFSESWAQLNYYRWWPLANPSGDFVVKADVQWSMASTVANWDLSGCGFVFGEQSNNNHYLIFLSLQGYVHMWRNVNHSLSPLAIQNYGKVDIPKGGAELVLAVSGQRVTFFVNGQQMITNNVSGYKPGGVNITLLSGSNKEYGTKCEMTNIGVWEAR